MVLSGGKGRQRVTVSRSRRNMLCDARLVFWLIRPVSRLPGVSTSGFDLLRVSRLRGNGFTAARPRPVFTDFR